MAYLLFEATPLALLGGTIGATAAWIVAPTVATSTNWLFGSLALSILAGNWVALELYDQYRRRAAWPNLTALASFTAAGLALYSTSKA